MNEDGKFNIALFPIPGSVSFPQTVVTLHVFEPRYREMIKDCVKENILLGVTHTKSIERFASSFRTQINKSEDVYNSYKQNLSTFSPEDIFSAGTVKIEEETEDGRYVITIHMLKRFIIDEIIKEKPYKVARCSEYLDQKIVNFSDSTAKQFSQREEILNYLNRQLKGQSNYPEEEMADLRSETTINNFTFKLFRFVRLNDQMMQSMLNSQSATERLDIAYQVVRALQRGPDLSL